MVSEICRAKDPYNCPRHPLNKPSDYSEYITAKEKTPIGETQEQKFSRIFTVSQKTGETGRPSEIKGLSEEIAYNLFLRTKEKEAVIAQEWAERDANWKQHGFQYPNQTRLGEDWTTYAVQSSEELKHITAEEKQAIKFFTSNNYRWINGHLYGTQNLPDEDENSKHFMSQELSRHTIENYPNKNRVNEIVEVLDSALSAQNSEARVLYRGKSLKDTRFAGMSVSDLHTYVDDNYKLGETISMEGYQSTSPNPAAASSYSVVENGLGTKVEGLFFEMKTRKGLNISGLSLYGREAEVLLPRDTKWKIVAVHKSKRVKTATKSNSNKSGLIRKENLVTLIQMVEIE